MFLLVGTGLSMIDTVLTLHHQGHAGKIYAVSRHGLLPLSHSENIASLNVKSINVAFFNTFISKSHAWKNADSYRAGW